MPPDREHGDVVLAEPRDDECHPLGPLRRVAVPLFEVHQAVDPARTAGAGDLDLVAFQRYAGEVPADLPGLRAQRGVLPRTDRDADEAAVVADPAAVDGDRGELRIGVLDGAACHTDR